LILLVEFFCNYEVLTEEQQREIKAERANFTHEKHLNINIQKRPNIKRLVEKLPNGVHQYVRVKNASRKHSLFVICNTNST